MNKKIMLLLAVSLIAMLSSASAFTEADSNACKNATKTVSITGVQRNIYADFTFTSASHADFNRYVLQITGSTPALTLADINFSSGTTFTVGTLGEGDKVVAIIYRIDGNANGYCWVSDSAQVTSGAVLDAGRFLFYQILLAMATMVFLVILGVVIALFFRKTGFKLTLK